MTTFEHNGTVYNMTEEQIEAAYRFREHQHRLEDAKRQIVYYGFGTETPTTEEQAVFENRWGFDMDHALTLAEDVIDEFDRTFDCNVPENDLWDTAVEKVLGRERASFRDPQAEKFEQFLIDKNDLIDNAAYNLIRAIAETGTDLDDEPVIEWEMGMIVEVVDAVKYTLERDFKIRPCHPYHSGAHEIPCYRSNCLVTNCPFRRGKCDE